jgi:hypothetical protein
MKLMTLKSNDICPIATTIDMKSLDLLSSPRPTRTPT